MALFFRGKGAKKRKRERDADSSDRQLLLMLVRLRLDLRDEERRKEKKRETKRTVGSAGVRSKSPEDKERELTKRRQIHHLFLPCGQRVRRNRPSILMSHKPRYRLPPPIVTQRSRTSQRRLLLLPFLRPQPQPHRARTSVKSSLFTRHPSF